MRQKRGRLYRPNWLDKKKAFGDLIYEFQTGFFNGPKIIFFSGRKEYLKKSSQKKSFQFVSGFTKNLSSTVTCYITCFNNLKNY